MNINEKMKELEAVVGCDVEQDIYSGNGERYITFTYEDERPELCGDNRPLADTVYVQISYYCPKGYSYMADKHKIRDYLEKQGFKVTNIRCWLENELTGYQNIRHLIFETTYTQTRRK